MSSPGVIVVVSPKGGAGRTTTAAALGGVLARLRGDLVAALDVSPGTGNMATLMNQPGSAFGPAELLRDADRLARHSDLAPYVTRSNSGLYSVRSNPETDYGLGPAGHRQLLRVLARFYSIVVVDSGSGVRDPAFLALMEAAGAVVAVTGPTIDAADVLLTGLDWLAGKFPAVIGTAFAVINGVESGGRDVDRIAQALEERVAGVLQVPRDPHLAGGAIPRWELLARRTQDAYLELAAAAVGTLSGEADFASFWSGD
jgi:putative peptide zinc metalloprotease protein